MLSDLSRIFPCLLLFGAPGAMNTRIDPLSGKHLRVLAMPVGVYFILNSVSSCLVQRNASGHIVSSDGVQNYMIVALSQMLNFSYAYLPVIARGFEDFPNATGSIDKGASYYLLNDEADVYLSSLIATHARLEQADFPAFWQYGPFSTLIPYPREKFHLAASFQPLSYQVWVLLIFAAFFTILFLTLFQNYESCRQSKSEQGIKHQNKSALLYVMGNLVSQGQNYFGNFLAARILAGAWCCGCFFLVQIYCTFLTSHLTSPNQKPIVNSFFEIVDNAGVSLSVDREKALDKILQRTQSERVKHFLSVLKKDSRYITCDDLVDCLQPVKEGKAVYSAPSTLAKTIVASALKSTGKCDFSLTKETFWSSPVFTPLRKNSSYTESISRGILRLIHAGLINEWEKWYVLTPSQCTEINKTKKKTQLSIRHLSSAFLILIAGYLIAFAVFLLEKNCL